MNTNTMEAVGYIDRSSAQFVGYDRVEAYIKKVIEKSEITEACRAELKVVDRYNNDRRLKSGTNCTNIQALKKFYEYAKKPVKEASKEDFKDFFTYISCGNYSSQTVNKWITCLKKAGKIVYDSDEIPAQLKWLKPLKITKTIKEEDMLNLEDVQALTDACETKRERAIVQVLFWSGCRVSEFTGMKLKGLRQIDNGRGISIPVEGKTGYRQVTIYDQNCILHLRKYLEEHETKTWDNALLFYTRARQNFGARMTKEGLAALIRRVAHRSGITKPINPHNFRHSLAVYYKSLGGEKTVSDDILMKHFGWHTREMITHYGAISNKKVEQGIGAANGIKSEDTDNPEQPKPIKCRCGAENPIGSLLCSACNSSLTLLIKDEFDPTQLSKDQLNMFLDMVEERLKQRAKEEKSKEASK